VPWGGRDQEEGDNANQEAEKTFLYFDAKKLAMH